MVSGQCFLRKDIGIQAWKRRHSSSSSELRVKVLRRGSDTRVSRVLLDSSFSTKRDRARLSSLGFLKTCLEVQVRVLAEESLRVRN